MAEEKGWLTRIREGLASKLWAREQEAVKPVEEEPEPEVETLEEKVEAPPVVEEKPKPEVSAEERVAILAEYRTHLYESDNPLNGMHSIIYRWKETGVEPFEVFEEALEKIEDWEELLQAGDNYRGFTNGKFKLPRKLYLKFMKQLLDEKNVDDFKAVYHHSHMKPEEVEDIVQEGYRTLLADRENMYRIKYLKQYTQIPPSKEVVQEADRNYVEQGEVSARNLLRVCLDYMYPVHLHPELDFGISR